MLERDDINVIDIDTPNGLHAEIAIAAAKAGKHVLCEKPLAMNALQAKEMWKAAEQAGVVHMICHNYRFAPAVQWAEKLIARPAYWGIFIIFAPNTCRIGLWILSSRSCGA